MVKRRRTSRKPVRGSKAKFKKCIIAKIRGTKITTPLSARKAFSRAAKKCKHLLVGVKVHRTKRRGRKRTYHRRMNRPFTVRGFNRYTLPFGEE
jgi:hypothetical protein